jgi:hypothetical protein
MKKADRKENGCKVNIHFFSKGANNCIQLLAPFCFPVLQSIFKENELKIKMMYRFED